MNNFLVVIAFFITIFSCKNVDNKSQNTQKSIINSDTVSVGTYQIDTSQSILYWLGSKSTGSSHNGSVKIQSGNLNFNEKNLVSGKVIIDMKSIGVIDISDPAEKKDLEDHLMNYDFFDVNTFPNAQFEISNVMMANHPDSLSTIDGSLSIKNITQALTVRAKIAVSGNMVMISVPEFIIDRTQFGIMYKSQKILNQIKDKFIRDEISLSMKIIASSLK